MGNITRFTYDKTDHLVAVSTPNGAVKSYARDAAGNIISMTDGDGSLTEFIYDGNRRLTAARYSDGTADQRTYDAAGQLIAQSPYVPT